MEFKSFSIENFRGVQKVYIDFTATPSSHVYALVGLNESGKTTILEAINHFTYKKENESLEPLDLPGYAISDVHSLIPIAQQSNFNGKIVFTSELLLNESDRESLVKHLQKTNNFNLKTHISNITITRSIHFKNSKFWIRTSNWSLSLSGTKGKGTKLYQIKQSDEIWKSASSFIQNRLPSVLYFPNFLFDFPDRIYLEDEEDADDKISRFYRLILQDILDAMDQRLELKTHTTGRAKSNDLNEKKFLDQVLLDMGRNVTETVFGSWHKIFPQKIEGKKIVIRCKKDEEDKHFIEFTLEDTDGYFLVQQRSLGFRWFFVFLLLTKYRGARKGSSAEVLFLFDEPASNLHPSAQGQLLDSFYKLSKNCKVIYTTHSHHLIDPNSLEAIFVVKNEGLDYKNDADSYNAKKTNISLTKYREFSVKHPNQTDYYRPILDVLDVVPSKFDNIPDIIMLEGKNDFYSLEYMNQVILSKKNRIKLLPGTSSSNLEPIIRLYISWGRNFLVLLDSDKEGKKQKERYNSLFEILLINRIYDLQDIDNQWKNFEMENLFTPKDKINIQKLIYPNTEKYNKTHFNRSIQELLITKNFDINFENETLENFKKILSFLDEKLKVNSGI